MRQSQVIKSDDEIKAEMKAENASAKDIAAVLGDRQANADEAQAEYQKTHAPFDPRLQKQNQ